MWSIIRRLLDQADNPREFTVQYVQFLIPDHARTAAKSATLGPLAKIEIGQELK